RIMVQTELVDEDLKAAAPVPVGVVSPECVEGTAALPPGDRQHLVSGHVADLCSRVDEPADQPRAGDPIGLRPGPGDPDHACLLLGEVVTPVPGRAAGPGG